MSTRSNTGYAAWGSRQAQPVRLPTVIECVRCQNKKTAGHYSNKQLDELRKKIQSKKYDPARGGPILTCRTCMPGQTEELHCCICSETKSLDEFAKTQRSKPDQAECKICVTRRINTEPGEHGPPKLAFSDDPNIVGYSDSDSDTVTSNRYEPGSTNKLGSAFNKMSINGKENSESAPQAKPGWVPQDRASYNSSLKGYTNVPTTSASSRKAPGNAQASQPMSPAVGAASEAGWATASHRSGGSSVASRSINSPPPKTSKGGWAKPSRGPTEIDEVSKAGWEDLPEDDWGIAEDTTTIQDDEDLP